MPLSKVGGNRGKWTEKEENNLIQIVKNEQTINGYNSNNSSNIDWTRVSLLLSEVEGTEARVKTAVENRWKKLYTESLKRGYINTGIPESIPVSQPQPEPQSQAQTQLQVQQQQLQQFQRQLQPQPQQQQQQPHQLPSQHPVSVLQPNPTTHLSPIPHQPIQSLPASQTQVQTQTQSQVQPVSGVLKTSTTGFPMPGVPLKLASGAILISLGAFSSASDDFPVGYKLIRTFPSMISTNTTQYQFSTFTTIISPKTLPEIQFQIQAADHPNIFYRNEIALEVWMKIQLQVLITHGTTKYWMSKAEAGLDMFGFCDPVVMNLLANMPKFNRTNLPLPQLSPPPSSSIIPLNRSTSSNSNLISMSNFPSIPSPPSNIKPEYDSSPYSPLADSLGIDLITSPGLPATVLQSQSQSRSQSQSQSPPMRKNSIESNSSNSNLGTSTSTRNNNNNNNSLGWNDNGSGSGNSSLERNRSLNQSSPSSSILSSSSPQYIDHSRNVSQEIESDVATRIQPKRKATKEITRDSFNQSSDNSDVDDDFI